MSKFDFILYTFQLESTNIFHAPLTGYEDRKCCQLIYVWYTVHSLAQKKRWCLGHCFNDISPGILSAHDGIPAVYNFNENHLVMIPTFGIACFTGLNLPLSNWWEVAIGHWLQAARLVMLDYQPTVLRGNKEQGEWHFLVCIILKKFTSLADGTVVRNSSKLLPQISRTSWFHAFHLCIESLDGKFYKHFVTSQK